jgi:sodium/hydrogen antiporter
MQYVTHHTSGIMAPSAYAGVLIIMGVAILMTALLPRIADHRPLALPMVALLFGYAVFSLSELLQPLELLDRTQLIKHMTEVGLVLALMSTGLKIDRAPGLRRWRTTWRIVLIAMPLTALAAAALAWGVAGFALATAILFAASLVPTDPVLAGDVETRPPEQHERKSDGDGNSSNDDGAAHREEREVRLALTSEAGFSDAVAFPLTYLAILMATTGMASGWLWRWAAWDLGYRIAIAIVCGIVLGRLLAFVMLGTRQSSAFGELMTGIGSIAAALLVFGVTELAQGNGLLAVFVAGVTIRNVNPRHRHQMPLRELSEIATRLASTTILITLGGAVAGGLLAPLTWTLVVLALVLILVVRPAAAGIALLGCRHLHWLERAVIAFFGIRGIGSLFYMSYGMTAASFAQAGELAALVGLVVVISVFLHGALASPVMDGLHRWEERRAAKFAETRAGG